MSCENEDPNVEFHGPLTLGEELDQLKQQMDSNYGELTALCNKLWSRLDNMQGQLSKIETTIDEVCNRLNKINKFADKFEPLGGKGIE